MIFRQEQLIELQNKIDIPEFYQKFLPDLKVRGTKMVTPCFAHADSKPSLFIDGVTGVGHCFSCGMSFNIFSFYQKFFNVPFQQAVLQIAEMYDYKMELNAEEQAHYDYTKKLYSVNKYLSECYQKALQQNKQAYHYLSDTRGLTPKTITDYGLGLGIDKLPDKESLKILGLLRESSDSNSWYSTFRSDRVVMPFKDEYGNIVSFSGRFWVNKDGAKYMYTTDTPIFQKSNYLYGLYEAKKYIKMANKVILVEGGFDLLKCHQKGLLHTVCMGTTSLTEAQINKLKKYTNNFYIVLEDDAMLQTGNDGVSKLDKNYQLIKQCIPFSRVYVVDLRNPDGSKCDPDEFLTKYSRDEFLMRVKQAKVYNEFVINSKIKDVNPRNIEEKSACINLVTPLLSQITDFITRKQYIELVANKLCIPENDLYRKIKWHNDKLEKINTSNITWDSRPVYAQKVLLSMCFAPQFNTIQTALLINQKVLEYMEPFYKNVFKLVLNYIVQHRSDTNISFKEFFNNVSYDDDISDVEKKVLSEAYMKVDNFEDLDSDDLPELIDEQIETLKEYVLPTSESTLEQVLDV